MLRELTIEAAHRPLRRGGMSEYSLIRLKGKWLKEAGFAAGKKVTVSVEHHHLHGSRMIIEPVKP